MKKVLILCAVMFSLTVYAQSDSTKKERNYALGLQLGTSVNFINLSFIINPLITFSNDKHQFELGPKFFTGYWSESGTRFGVEANYKYFPNSKTTPFSSYLLVNQEYYYVSRHSSYEDYYSIPNEVHTVIRNSDSHGIAMQLGYGIQWRFLRELYISTDVSIGGLYSVTKGSRTSTEPSLNNNWRNSYIEPSFRPSVALGWRF